MPNTLTIAMRLLVFPVAFVIVSSVVHLRVEAGRQTRETVVSVRAPEEGARAAEVKLAVIEAPREPVQMASR